jgi:hypothetical protein
VRAPPDAQLQAPEFPPGIEWLNTPFMRMDRLIGSHAVLVEFWDYARINSLRTLPYLQAWRERYGAAGLEVIGVHSPGYSFGGDPKLVARAVERLAIEHAVALDPDLGVWRLYGNKGWPGRYLFDRRSNLRYLHYGEGDYLDCELAIQELLRDIEPELQLPNPLEPLRPEDAPGAMLEPQTAEVVLPADRPRLRLSGEWRDGADCIEATSAGATASVEFQAGAAYAVLSGTAEPGLRETNGTVEAREVGLRLHGFQFTPLPPA